MASLEDQFDKETDLSKAFDKEEDVAPSKKAKLLKNIQALSEPMGDDSLMSKFIESTPEEKEAMGRGARSGLTLGAPPKVAGKSQELADVLSKTKEAPPKDMNSLPQSELMKAMKKMSPTQLNAFLKAQGFKGDIGPTSSDELYKQGIAEEKAKEEASQKAAPMAYLGGQLGGSLAGAAMTGGYGTAALAPKVAQALGASETGLIAASKLPGAMPLIKAAGTEAISAAPMGATYGALTSEPGKELSGAVKGAAEAGTAAVAIKGAMEGIPAAAKYLGNKVGEKIEKVYTPKEGATSIAKQSQKSYEAGRRGENWNSPEFLRGETPEAKELGLTGTQSYTNFADRNADQAAQSIIDIDTHLGKGITNSLEEATKAGKQFNLASPEMRNATADLKVTLGDEALNISKTAGLRDLENKLTNISSMTPVQAKSLKDDIYNVIKQYKDDNSPSSKEVVNKLTSFVKSLDEDLRTQVPEYAQASDRFRAFRTNVSDPLVSDPQATTFNVGDKNVRTGYDYFGNDLEKNRLELKSRMQNFIKDLSKPGADRPSQVYFNKLKDNLDKYKQYESSLGHPESEYINKTLDDTFKNVEQAAITNEAKGSIHKLEPLTPPSTSLTPVGTIKQATGAISNALTDVTANSMRNKTANLVGRIQGGIEKGKISPAIQETLNKLKNVSPTESVRNNALLNTLLQNGTIRNYLDNESEESK